MTGYTFTSHPSERDVIEALLEAHPGLLSRVELVRLIGDSVMVEDALAHLRMHGLAHEASGYVWASWAAIAAAESPHRLRAVIAARRPGRCWTNSATRART